MENASRKLLFLFMYLCVCVRTHSCAITYHPPEKILEEILTTSLFHRFTAIFSNPQTIGK